ncbi:MAG: hypothetical protein VKJ06_08395 [Vampirovibrionales bacterium]|nr:hypothetical protein [Vampirovibrionales bacterium]
MVSISAHSPFQVRAQTSLKKARFGNQTPPAAAAQPAPQAQATTAAPKNGLVSRVVKGTIQTLAGGIQEVKANLGWTLKWTLATGAVGLIPFMHAFLIPAVAMFPLLAAFNFIGGAAKALASQPGLDKLTQQASQRAKQAWQAAKSSAQAATAQVSQVNQATSQATQTTPANA